jgi:transcription termination factor Rho
MGEENNNGDLFEDDLFEDSSSNDRSIMDKKEESSSFKININDLHSMEINELYTLAGKYNIEGLGALEKKELVSAILRAYNLENDKFFGGGVLQLVPDGYGFLRSEEYNYLPSQEDIYVAGSQVKRYSLRSGDFVEGEIRPPSYKKKQKYFALKQISLINSEPPEVKKKTIPFENLTPDFPERRMIMETKKPKLSMRALDLITPIGFGQRGLIVAPPRVGKTIIMQDIANSISENNPKAKLIVLLIDERPEEVTEMRRSIRGEVISSTFDEPQYRHCEVAEMVIERCKRLVEHGEDVIILLDSITRLARAYNSVQPHSGKILSGGVDANALHKPKRFFGAARNTQESGSLTIIATALIDTGSKMDEVIFEEFKGTGNMEIFLDRSLADKRIYPAINIEKSGTRKEELLLHPEEKVKMWDLRRAMLGSPAHDSMGLLLNGIKKSKSNLEFLMNLKKR